jgi:hypothetical protein
VIRGQAHVKKKRIFLVFRVIQEDYHGGTKSTEKIEEDENGE